MNLTHFPGKKVRIIDNEGLEYEGVVWDYVHPDDNEPEGIEGIIVDYLIRADGQKYQNPVLFNAPDIKYIEEI